MLDMEVEKSGDANTQVGGQQIGLARPGFFGFQPPKASRGCSRPYHRRNEEGPVSWSDPKFGFVTFSNIPKEIFRYFALCIVGGEV